MSPSRQTRAFSVDHMMQKEAVWKKDIAQKLMPIIPTEYSIVHSHVLSNFDRFYTRLPLPCTVGDKRGIHSGGARGKRSNLPFLMCEISHVSVGTQQRWCFRTFHLRKDIGTMKVFQRHSVKITYPFPDFH